MDQDIKKLKEMWKQKKSTTMNSIQLINRLNQIEKNANSKRIFLSIMLSILGIASIVCVSEILSNMHYIIAYLLIIMGVLFRLIPLYRSRFEMIKDEISNNHKYIEKLREKLKFKTLQLLVFMTLIIVALNFAILGLNEKGSIFNFPLNDENKVYFHIATFFLFIIAYLNKKRIMNNKRNSIIELIDDLENNTSN